MAATTAALSDPLVLLRASITSQKPPVLTTTSEPAGASDITDSLSTATHLQFNHDDDHHAFELSTLTRFISSEKPVDLRSIYLAWQNKDIGVSEYVQAVQQLNEELPSGAGGSVVALKFVEKLSLTTWLEGAADESDYLKPLASEDAAKQAGAAADVAAGAAGGVAVAPSGSRGARVIDERLVEILRQERKMGDRNTVLRGIKPTVMILIGRISFSMLTSNVGLLTHPQERRTIPLPQPPAPERSDSSPVRSQPCAGLESEKAYSTRRTNHPPLSVALIAAEHVERQILPPRRRIRSIRQQFRLKHIRQHLTHFAHTTVHRPQQTTSIHYSRQR